MGDGDLLRVQLRQLGLSEDEAMVFMSLLDAPRTQLEVSRATGIARSNVYRLVDQLASKGVVHESVTDNGKLIASALPESLELLVVEQERLARERRAGFDKILPILKNIQGRDSAFETKTYSGIPGLKQMLWNELKTQGEILMFSCGPLDQVTGRYWAENYRAEIIHRGIVQRSIENKKIQPSPSASQLSEHEAYPDFYLVRYIPDHVLAIHHELTIHDDTVSFYNSWTDNTQIGTEIKNPFLAAFMRQMFEHYWSIAAPPPRQ